MPLTIFSDKVRFHYKSKNWQYQFNEIKELELLKKKKKKFLKNGAFIAVTAATCYCMLFSNLMNLYCIILAIGSKIAIKDCVWVGEQIDYYLGLQL